METKTIVLSSVGFANISQNSLDESSEFCFIFGPKEVRMNSIHAEFISPIVARSRRSDPTLNYINFDEFYSFQKETYSHFANEILTEEIIFLFKTIATGASIDINNDQAFYFRFLSIMIGNEELFSLINEKFSIEFNEDTIDLYIDHIQCCYYFSKLCPDFSFKSIIEFLSSNFCSIDQKDLLKLPKSILFTIISNDHLVLKDEDSLFDFIQQIFLSKDEASHRTNQEDEKDDGLDIVSFYEKLDFSSLSPYKFNEIFSDFDLNDLTNSLWRNVVQSYHSPSKKNSKRYFKGGNTFEYDGKPENGLKGIISHLIEENGGNGVNLHDKGVVKITASSVFSDHGFDREPRNIVDFNNDDNRHIFTSKYDSSAWIKIDFKTLKIRPTHYSLKCGQGRGSDSGYPKNWRLEGSNDDSDWTILDNHSNDRSFTNDYEVKTFKIQTEISEDKSFRYLRLKQTGDNSSNKNLLILSAMEFFGALIKPESA